MLLKEKLSRETGNRIHFYREGMFWKLYNQSAFNFSQRVKQYLLKKKYIKEVKSWIVTMGFPDVVLKENLERLREYTLSVNVSEKVVEVELKEGLPGYQEWFEEIKEEVKGVREVKEEGTVPVVGNEDEKERILKDIRDFPILQKTPLDVQMFFIELQNRVVKLDK
ncbi:MAG: hypothetical protein OSJ36_09515 [Odoribacter sp.]|nr:hypothetical protein [Odoribacter sp.]